MPRLKQFIRRLDYCILGRRLLISIKVKADFVIYVKQYRYYYKKDYLDV